MIEETQRAAVHSGQGGKGKRAGVCRNGLWPQGQLPLTGISQGRGAMLPPRPPPPDTHYLTLFLGQTGPPIQGAVTSLYSLGALSGYKQLFAASGLTCVLLWSWAC